VKLSLTNPSDNFAVQAGTLSVNYKVYCSVHAGPGLQPRTPMRIPIAVLLSSTLKHRFLLLLACLSQPTSTADKV
jgi:hypothetical protein